MKAQRLRFRYRLTAAGAALKHREIVDAWIDALGRGRVQVAVSEGKRQVPLISLAAPLPQGATSDYELVDVFLSAAVDPRQALDAASPHLPPGVEALGVCEVGVGAASLQSALRWAEYEVEIPADGLTAAQVEGAIAQLLAADSMPVEYRRENKVRKYDLRPLVLDLRLTGSGEQYTLLMRLRAEQDATARADQTVLALGLPEAGRVHRTRMYLEDTPAVLMAYRRSAEADA